MANPSLPHEDQPHLHGALPDLDSFLPANLGQDAGLLPGENGLFVGLDTLSSSSHVASINAYEVLVVGYEGGLTVSRIGGGSGTSRDKKGVEESGRLEGLGGTVMSAKILPATTRGDNMRDARPLIAVVLHSPQMPTPEPSQYEDDGSAIATDTEDSTPDIRRQNNTDPYNRTNLQSTSWLHDYQTTVEIYSLLDQRHICTLYSSRRMVAPADMAVPKPQPIRLDANGKFVTVTAGLSGEVFIFSCHTGNSEISTDAAWRCVCKLWTTVSERTYLEKTDLDSLDSPVEENQRRVFAPLVSMSSRWIALAPPPSAGSQMTVGGIAKDVVSSSDARIPGITAATAPSPPSITCNLDAQTVGFMSRLSREATQNILKGAQWTFDRGMEAYNTYWNKSSPPQHPVSSAHGLPSDRRPNPMFPPTHAFEQPNGTFEEAKLVAIYDLERFLESEDGRKQNALNPVAVFQPPSGISHLSFAPAGWNLLVVNRKGDDTTLWNLMKIVHSSADEIAPEGEKENIIEPFAKHAWNTARMSEARIVDVSWAEPLGDRIAILTDKPTVHVHDIPHSALQWPPPRKRRAKALQQTQQSAIEESTTSEKRWSSALETLNGAVKSVRDTSRSLSIGGVSNAFSGLTTSSTAATAKSGSKFVRQGFSKGMDALSTQAQHVYHMQDNKLHLEHPPDGIALPGLIRLSSHLNKLGIALNGAERGRSNLLVLESGALRVHPIRQILQRRKDGPSTYHVKISKRHRRLQLPSIPDNRFPPAFIAAVEGRYGGTAGHNIESGPGQDGESEPTELSGYWALRPPKAVFGAEGAQENWHAVMEAESNPPFQPFHFQRRYNQFSFSPAPPSPPPSSQAQQDNALPTTGFEAPAETAGDAEEEEEEEQYGYEDEGEAQKDADSPDWDALEHDALLQHQHHVSDHSPWLFGAPVAGRKVQMPRQYVSGGVQEDSQESLQDNVIENRITVVDMDSQGPRMTVQSIRRRVRDEEVEFFEDGVEVVELID